MPKGRHTGKDNYVRGFYCQEKCNFVPAGKHQGKDCSSSVSSSDVRCSPKKDAYKYKKNCNYGYQGGLCAPPAYGYKKRGNRKYTRGYIGRPYESSCVSATSCSDVGYGYSKYGDGYGCNKGKYGGGYGCYTPGCVPKYSCPKKVQECVRKDFKFRVSLNGFCRDNSHCNNGSVVDVPTQGWGWADVSLSFNTLSKTAVLTWNIQLRNTAEVTAITFNGPIGISRRRYSPCTAVTAFDCEATPMVDAVRSIMNCRGVDRSTALNAIRCEAVGECTISCEQADQIFKGLWYLEVCTNDGSGPHAGKLRGIIC